MRIAKATYTTLSRRPLGAIENETQQKAGVGKSPGGGWKSRAVAAEAEVARLKQLLKAQKKKHEVFKVETAKATRYRTKGGGFCLRKQEPLRTRFEVMLRQTCTTLVAELEQRNTASVETKPVDVGGSLHDVIDGDGDDGEDEHGDEDEDEDDASVSTVADDGIGHDATPSTPAMPATLQDTSNIANTTAETTAATQHMQHIDGGTADATPGTSDVVQIESMHANGGGAAASGSSARDARASSQLQTLRALKAANGNGKEASVHEPAEAKKAVCENTVTLFATNSPEWCSKPPKTVESMPPSLTGSLTPNNINHR